MKHFTMREIICNQNLDKELEEVGFDIAYKNIFKDKFKHKNLKIYNLSCGEANILKQTALIYGADCAVNKNVITGKVEQSNVILCGSISQLKKIAEKLKTQPFKLKLLGEEIINALAIRNTETKIVGILNVTPNSFSDGGCYYKPDNAIKHLEELITDGADVIDIGAESTKPFAEAVSSEEQIKRLTPILNFINKENLSVPISIDTRSSQVADFCLNNGAVIINDVSGFDFDKNMPNIIAKHNATIIIQHSLGTPKTMQINPTYKNVNEDIFLSLFKKIEYAKMMNIQKIIADPGIGFGKSKTDNLEILNNIEAFFNLNCPIMVGLSRKSFLYAEIESNDIKDTLSLALSYPLLLKQVDYLRVHNVKLYKHVQKLL